jgi:thioredoxin 1
MSENIVEISDSSFETEVIRNDRPVVVDFWAPWCAPCWTISKIVEELAAAFGDKLKFTKCNVDKNPVTPTRYGVQAIPNLIFFKDGAVADQIVGVEEKATLENVIKNLIRES